VLLLHCPGIWDRTLGRTCIGESFRLLFYNIGKTIFLTCTDEWENMQLIIKCKTVIHLQQWAFTSKSWSRVGPSLVCTRTWDCLGIPGDISFCFIFTTQLMHVIARLWQFFLYPFKFNSLIFLSVRKNRHSSFPLQRAIDKLSLLVYISARCKHWSRNASCFSL